MIRPISNGERTYTTADWPGCFATYTRSRISIDLLQPQVAADPAKPVAGNELELLPHWPSIHLHLLVAPIQLNRKQASILVRFVASRVRCF